MWLALWMVHDDSHSTLRSISRKNGIGSLTPLAPSREPSSASSCACALSMFKIASADRMIRLAGRSLNATYAKLRRPQSLARPRRRAISAGYETPLVRRSSVVEQVAVNHLVGGSNPSAG